MTSMRMRLLFSLSFVHVLVRYIGGEGRGGGVRGEWGGVMTSMRMRLLFSPSFAGAVHCGSSQKRPVQLDSPRTNAHLEANQTNCSCSHVQMTMLLMLLMPRSFFDQVTIVLAADDHEYDSVVRLRPCCKVTFEMLPVALSTRVCRFLLLHFGNVRHAKSTSFLKLSRQKLQNLP